MCIAIAVSLGPDLMIADEPTTALDVTVQRMVLQSIKEVKEKIGDYLISEKAIRFAEEAIENAVDFDIVIIDEFGRLEREKKGLYKAIEKLVRNLKELDETTLIMVIQNDVINEALALLELDPEKIWEVQK